MEFARGPRWGSELGSRGARAMSCAGIAREWRGLTPGIRGAPERFPRGPQGRRGARAALARGSRGDFIGALRGSSGFRGVPRGTSGVSWGLREPRAGSPQGSRGTAWGSRGVMRGSRGARGGRARGLGRLVRGPRAVCLWLSRGPRAVPRGSREASFEFVLSLCLASPELTQELREARAKLAREAGAGLALASRGPARRGSLGARAGATRRCDKSARCWPRLSVRILATLPCC